MNQLTTIEDRDTEITEVGLTTAHHDFSGDLTRVQIDAQIERAMRFPRSLSQAVKDIRTLVTLDKDAAAECMYALPRGGKPIQGPSIRLAEIIYQCWGNAICDAEVIEVDRAEKVVIARGTYIDLQKNATSRSTVRRRIVDSKGRLFNDDMITVTGNAACSIAKRNAILAGVPKAVWNKAYEDAREVVAGTIKTLAVSRDQAIAAFANFGVKPEQIYPAIGVAGPEEITTDHILLLRGMFAAIKNGEATVEETFNPRKTASTHEKVSNPLADVPEHDAETGEIRGDTKTKDKPATGEVKVATQNRPDPGDEADGGDAGGADDAGAGTGQPAPAPDEDPAKTVVMQRLRKAAEKGTPALRRAIGGLVPVQNEMLTNEDHDALGDLAEQADARAV